MINQISYNFGKGFGVMACADMNSVVGFSPIIGPQHNYTSKKVLAVIVLSYFLNGDSDPKLLGLAVHLDQFGPKQIANENHRVFLRGEF